MLKPIFIADETLDRIESTIAEDQGDSFRRYLREYIPLAEDVYRTGEDPFRSHLGASQLGRECAREVWYSWRWTTKPNFPGRIVRLFNRGHLEEPRFLAMLSAIGCEVWFADEKGEQFRIGGYRGHFGGGVDAVIRGIPELPGESILGEFKTHGEKSFEKLRNEGVRSSKFEHYVQMQKYMGKLGLAHGLYMAVNKNTDELYAEIIEYDSDVFNRMELRVVMLIDAKEPPGRISETPGWYKCKFCDHHSVCHSNAPPERNCRTCHYSMVGDGGSWWCGNAEAPRHQAGQPLSKAEQMAGCPLYELNRFFNMK